MTGARGLAIEPTASRRRRSAPAGQPRIDLGSLAASEAVVWSSACSAPPNWRRARSPALARGRRFARSRRHGELFDLRAQAAHLVQHARHFRRGIGLAATCAVADSPRQHRRVKRSRLQARFHAGLPPGSRRHAPGGDRQRQRDAKLQPHAAGAEHAAEKSASAGPDLTLSRLNPPSFWARSR